MPRGSPFKITCPLLAGSLTPSATVRMSQHEPKLQDLHAAQKLRDDVEIGMNQAGRS